MTRYANRRRRNQPGRGGRGSCTSCRKSLDLEGEYVDSFLCRCRLCRTCARGHDQVKCANASAEVAALKQIAQPRPRERHEDGCPGMWACRCDELIAQRSLRKP